MSDSNRLYDAENASTQRMARHTVWNLLGMTLPMAIALFAIPALDRGLGRERFGALGLVWMLVGYFNLFDMGLGRALTKLMAERIAQHKDEEAPGLFWTSIWLMLGLGVLAGVILYVLAPAFACRWLKIEPGLQSEAMQAFRVTAFGMPIVVLTVGLVGVLEACHRFGLLNIIRVPMGSLTFLAPLLVLPFSQSLVPVAAVLIGGKMIECVIYFAACLRAVPSLRHSMAWRSREVKPLFSFGGWMTVSNTIVPVLTHIDRFLIGAVRSMTAVTFFMVPAEVIVKMLIVPRAWVSVLFPNMVASFSGKGEPPSVHLDRGFKFLGLVMFLPAAILVAFAPEGLGLWLGDDYVANSTAVVRLLTVGVFLHGLARVPWFQVQAAGRPRLAACLHAIELPLHLALAIPLIRHYGIAGAATAWLLRVTYDLVILTVMAVRVTPGASVRTLRGSALSTLLAVLVYAAVAYLPALAVRATVLAAGVLLFYAVNWFAVLSSDDRNEIVGVVRTTWEKNVGRSGRV